MEICSLPGHERCSFNLALRFGFCEVSPGNLGGATKLLYGTSDTLPNPVEILIGKLAAEALVVELETDFYPRGEIWGDLDRQITFAPHGHQWPHAPAKVLQEAGLTGCSAKTMLDVIDPSLIEMTLHEACEHIRKLHHNPAFNVLNVWTGYAIARAQRPSQGKGGKRKTTERRYEVSPWYFQYQNWTLGRLLQNPTIKLGGSLLYFLMGHYCAKNAVVHLLPHNQIGGAYAASAAGAKLADRPLLVYPSTGVDFMTTEQWRLKEADGVWRVAPPWLLKEFMASSLFVEFRRRFAAAEYSPIEARPDGEFVFRE